MIQDGRAGRAREPTKRVRSEDRAHQVLLGVSFTILYAEWVQSAYIYIYIDR